MTDKTPAALTVAETINFKLYDIFGDDPDVPNVSFVSNGFTEAIMLDDVCIWDDQNDDRYDENDNEIPLLDFVVAAMQKQVAKYKKIADLTVADFKKD